MSSIPVLIPRGTGFAYITDNEAMKKIHHPVFWDLGLDAVLANTNKVIVSGTCPKKHMIQSSSNYPPILGEVFGSTSNEFNKKSDTIQSTSYQKASYDDIHDIVENDLAEIILPLNQCSAQSTGNEFLSVLSRTGDLPKTPIETIVQSFHKGDSYSVAGYEPPKFSIFTDFAKQILSNEDNKQEILRSPEFKEIVENFKKSSLLLKDKTQILSINSITAAMIDPSLISSDNQFLIECTGILFARVDQKHQIQKELEKKSLKEYMKAEKLISTTRETELKRERNAELKDTKIAAAHNKLCEIQTEKEKKSNVKAKLIMEQKTMFDARREWRGKSPPLMLEPDPGTLAAQAKKEALHSRKMTLKIEMVNNSDEVHCEQLKEVVVANYEKILSLADKRIQRSKANLTVAANLDATYREKCALEYKTKCDRFEEKKLEVDSQQQQKIQRKMQRDAQLEFRAEQRRVLLEESRIAAIEIDSKKNLKGDALLELRDSVSRQRSQFIKSLYHSHFLASDRPSTSGPSISPGPGYYTPESDQRTIGGYMGAPANRLDMLYRPDSRAAPGPQDYATEHDSGLRFPATKALPFKGRGKTDVDWALRAAHQMPGVGTYEVGAASKAIGRSIIGAVSFKGGRGKSTMETLINSSSQLPGVGEYHISPRGRSAHRREALQGTGLLSPPRPTTK